MSTKGCPGDDVFMRLVEGLLPEAEVRALESHCDGCLTCARTMAELARAISPSGGGLLDDRYRLLEPLGAGGMGVVYAAFDTKLSRKVAIKRLRETGAGTPAEKRRGRFLREAQLLASLSHPNVLTVHDVGGADRELYVVMELVDGAPISRWLSETRPGWRAIIDVYLQAGRGLVAAHQLGIVHRDIKPDNILVAKSGRVLVGDFGLAGLAGNLTPAAHETSPAPAGLGSLTQTGAVLGTPAYMSPEQHDGKTGDAQSDQFSFAVSLYESLHGRRPFAGRSASEIAAATRSGQRAPGGDGIPRGVDRVLSVALDPDPGRRFASMEDLLAALEQSLRRRPVVAAVAAVAVLLVAGAVGARLWSSRPPGSSPPTVAQSAAATPIPAAKIASPAVAPVAGAPGAAQTASATPPPGEAAEKASGAPRHRRQMAQAPPLQAGQVPPPMVVQNMILGRAAEQLHKRDGAACLAALDEVTGEWTDVLAARAQETRGDCELLAGHCDKGRKLLEPMYLNNRAYAGNTGEGLLSARVARMCPAASFATVDKRIMAVSLQANAANSAAGNQAKWCGTLERVLLADTKSAEVQACFSDISTTNKSTTPCYLRLHDLGEAYRYLAECFLRDKNCRAGARLDVMHSQVESMFIMTDNPRMAERWCRPTRVEEMYTACTAEGAEVERQCMARVEAAKSSGVARLTPEILPR